MTDVDAAQFRALCGRFVTGVVVITATTPNGAPAGMTANSFTSVSLTPPLVSVNVDRAADFHAVIATARQFAINVLRADQEAISRRFATPVEGDRFAGIGYRKSESGRILLLGAIATIECDLHQRIEIGDHSVVVGRVVGGAADDGRPLLYFRGGYRNLA